MRTFVCVMAVAALASLAACTGSLTSPDLVPSGPLRQIDLTLGTGAVAATGKQVTVDYTGWLQDPSQTDGKGQQFDTSIGRGPFGPFALGAGAVIRGWDQGLVGMKVGGKRRLIVPPALAYGSTGSGTIPPNATLVFDIDLLSVG
jgi:FKBP-type peptidyl-prolyl cis-trans isomerase FkpA